MRAMSDPALDNCTGPILYDDSSVQQTLIMYMPMQGMQVYGSAGPSCYNAISDLKFMFQGDIGSRVRFDKSYIKMDYMACDISVPSPYAEVDLTHVSIPWNPIAATFQNVYYQLNGTNQTVERYDSNFQHGNMIKILTSYTRQALEEATDRFFTPCIESTRDTITGLSMESADRAKAAFQRDVSGTINLGSKIIMLSDIFDSLKVETACFAQLFQLYMTLKAPDQILFAMPAVTGINRFYITGLRLYIAQDKLSSRQLDIETKKTMDNVPMVRNGYRRFDVFTDSHVSSKSYITTGIKNLQASVLMFSSVTAGDGVGINPYQYCYCSSITPNTGITHYRHRYGSIVYPLSGQNVDPINKARNTDVYTIWRALCRLINDKTFSSAIPFTPCMGVNGPLYDISTYAFFPAIFCNQDTAPMKLASGGDHEIIVNGGHTGATGIIVRIRLNSYAIYGDSTVTIMD